MQNQISERDLKSSVVQWAKTIGEKQAFIRLVSRGVSATAAQLIIKNRYVSTPKQIFASILLEEIQKDGFLID
jgi:hypothetical protein